MSEGWTVQDEGLAAVAGYGPTEPFFVGFAFFTGLVRLVEREDVEGTLAGMQTCVTPELWADPDRFFEIFVAFSTIERPGVATFPHSPDDAPDVAHLKILSDAVETVSKGPGDTRLEGWFSLVWRPEFGAWLVHAMGAEPLPAASMPRTSPGVAPRYTTMGNAA